MTFVRYAQHPHTYLANGSVVYVLRMPALDACQVEERTQSTAT